MEEVKRRVTLDIILLIVVFRQIETECLCTSGRCGLILLYCEAGVACRNLIICCSGINTYRAFIPAAATAGVADTHSDRILAAIIDVGGVNRIYAVDIPRIRAVIDTDVFRSNVISHAGRSDKMSVDICLVGLIEKADCHGKIFCREVSGNIECADVPRIAAVIVLAAEGLIKITCPPAEAWLYNSPGLIDIRCKVGDSVEVDNSRVIPAIGLIGLEIPVAHKVDQFLIVCFAAILYSDQIQSGKFMLHTKERNAGCHCCVETVRHVAALKFNVLFSLLISRESSKRFADTVELAACERICHLHCQCYIRDLVNIVSDSAVHCDLHSRVDRIVSACHSLRCAAEAPGEEIFRKSPAESVQ